MSITHWKVVAKRQWSTIPQGAEVDIIVKNRTGRPSIKEIGDAIEKKYGIKPPGGLPESTFDFTKG
jgi:hypothetical protein